MKERLKQKPMKNKKIGLAPLAGFSDRPFRTIAFDQGADFAVTEMVSIKGLLYHNKNTEDLLSIGPHEKEVWIQVFGHEPDIFTRVIQEHLNRRDDFCGIDLNMGCPAPKIVKNGDGSALMKEPKKVEKIVHAMVEASNKPVSVKIRLGFDAASVNYLEIGKICQDQGASQLTLHARTREAMYSGQADWQAIRKLKESLSIPVIGNGDVTDPQSAKALFELSGCDGIAIGRGAIGNPFLFAQIKAFFEKGTYEKPDLNQFFSLLKRHYDLEIEERGEKRALLIMRKEASHYFRGYHSSSHFNELINQIQSRDKLFLILDQYQKFLMEKEVGKSNLL